MNIVANLLPYILNYNYLAIFLITTISNSFFPIPSGTLLIASAAFSSQGYLSFFWVVIIGILGNIIGDNILYWLTRKYGLKILYKLGFKKRIESDTYKKLENKIKKNSGLLIFITRFNVLSSLIVNIISGLSNIPYKKYLFYDISGESIQVLFYCCIGYLVGNSWEVISNYINKILWIVLFIIVIILLFFWKKIWRKLIK